MSFDKELEQVYPDLLRFCRHLCSSLTDGEDLAQAVVCKAIVARNSYQEGTNFRAWVFTIARNSFLSERRRHWRSVPMPMSRSKDGSREEPISNFITVEPDAHSKLELSELFKAMEFLSPLQRAALEAVELDGMSYEEVAGMLGVEIGTAKSAVSRARVSLCDYFGVKNSRRGSRTIAAREIL